MTAAELLGTEQPPEGAEHAYRRGHCDGWAMAAEAISDAMAAKDSWRKACRLATAHYDGALYEWRVRRPDDDTAPPE